MRSSARLLVLALLIAAASVSAKTATPTKPTTQPHTTTPAKSTPAAPAAAPSTEVQLPVDPFTKIDAVLSGAEAEELKAAVAEAAKDDSVVKANKVYADCLAKYQNSTAGTKSSNLDSLKGSVKSLFAAEKSVILKANAKFSASIDKVEKAK